MRLLRGVAGALLWIVSALLALVAVVLCVTLILLPVGIPLLGYARRLFTLSLRLMMPKAIAHPVETADKSIKKRGRRAQKGAKKTVSAAKPDSRQLSRWRRKQTRAVSRRL